jgi:hypothetical protein
MYTVQKKSKYTSLTYILISKRDNVLFTVVPESKHEIGTKLKVLLLDDSFIANGKVVRG